VRAELYTALFVMAAGDPWGHILRKELVMMVEGKEEGCSGAHRSSGR
jgi:hypothetical protein